ncbi:MAG: type III secretion system export apparatus subunit SctR [Pseudomonadota bacterium]
MSPAVALAVATVQDSFSSNPLSIVFLLAILTLVPFVLVMITSFAKIVIVLMFLRTALGTPQVPPGIVITGLALILTAYVMAPTGTKVYEAAKSVKGAEHGFASASMDVIFQAADKAKEPVRDFLMKHSRPQERTMFLNMARRMQPKETSSKLGESDLIVVVPAFVVGQLALAFRIGFLIFVPFLIIDLVVANILLALGMHMLSPTIISLPFKLLLFVLVNGWQLLTQGLVLSYL